MPKKMALWCPCKFLLQTLEHECRTQWCPWLRLSLPIRVRLPDFQCGVPLPSPEAMMPAPPAVEAGRVESASSEPAVGKAMAARSPSAGDSETAAGSAPTAEPGTVLCILRLFPAWAKQHAFTQSRVGRRCSPVHSGFWFSGEVTAPLVPYLQGHPLGE